jgi:hypothetical protein
MATSLAVRPDAYCEPGGTVCNPHGRFGDAGPQPADTFIAPFIR